MKTLNDLLFTLILVLIVALLGFVGFEKYQNYKYAQAHQNDTETSQSQQALELQKLKLQIDGLQKKNESLSKDKSDLIAQLSKNSSAPDYSQQLNTISSRVAELSNKSPAACPERKDETSPKLWNRISFLETQNNRLRNSQTMVKKEVVTKVVNNPHDQLMLEYYGKLDKYQRNRISNLESQNLALAQQKTRQCEGTVVKTSEDPKVVVRAIPTTKPDQSRLQLIHKPLKIDRPDELPKRKVNTQVDELN